MKNIVDNNKLIAEFLEWNKGENYSNEFQFYEAFRESVYQTTPSEMKFHSDWNWLMPVVEKIESLDFIFEILSTRVDIADYRVIAFKKRFEPIIKETKIEAVYNACIEFIKWYNEQK